MDESTRYRLLKLLDQRPDLSQRDIADAMGVSLGKVNYCLRALIEKSLIKVGNFRDNPNKRAYAYLLTPQGIEEKARVTVRFLKRKLEEHRELEAEIARLKSEADTLEPHERT